MNPLLIAIAGQVLPEILKWVFGDKAGAVGTAVTKAVTDVAGADPAAAQKKVEDPQVAATLRAKLAEIAADEDEKKRQAQIATLKLQFEEAGKQREAEFETLKEQIKASAESTAGARSAFQAVSGGRYAWSAPVISLIVTAGFFIFLTVLAFGNITLQANSPVWQVFTVLVGTLAAGFATVLNFWLGSSEGSRAKDVAAFQIQQDQARQTSDAVRSQTDAAVKIASKGQPETKPGPAVKSKNFDKCLSLVFVQEGGFSNNPHDHGGPTNWGITKKELEIFRGHEVSVDDVKNLKKEEAIEIYRMNYWNKMQCDELPPGIDLIMFDFGVNAGPARATLMLQKIVGVTEDGSIGPITLAAVAAVDPKQLIRTMSQRRLEFYRGLEGWPHFGAGWTNRTNSIEKSALEMASA